MKRTKVILIWIIGVLFITTGILKFINVDPVSIAIFEKANYPSWLFYVVAVVEFVGGILLLIERTRQYGAMVIAIIMIGAIGTHIILKDNVIHTVVPALIIGFVVSLLKKLRRKIMPGKSME
jgi:putative oxidoreductase